jgi:hypothetical protein
MKETETPFSNTYGSLIIMEERGFYYAKMEDCFDSDEEEIPKYLYDALLKYTNEANENQPT